MKKIRLILLVLIVIVAIDFILAYKYFSTYGWEIGGQRDEHGCKVSANYSWCEPKNKCLVFWKKSCYGQDEEAIKAIFVQQKESDYTAEEISVLIMKEDGNQAYGAVTFGSSGGLVDGISEQFLAVRNNEKWQLVYSGYSEANCPELKKSFSQAMLEGICD